MFQLYISGWSPCIFINYMLCSSRDERFIMYQLWIDPKDKISLIWWRHLEYYWLIKYVSIVYSCSSIGRTQGCGSHTRFSLWQLFYNTSSWFMGAIYFPFSVHTERELHTLLLFTKYVLFVFGYAMLQYKLLLKSIPEFNVYSF